MEIQRRYFPYDKSIVINALYDTIEVLGLRLDSSTAHGERWSYPTAAYRKHADCA